MAEETTEAGGVEITTGSPGLGKTMAESSPLLGGVIKTFEAGGKLTDGASGSEVLGLMSEGTNFVQACQEVKEIATDPIGWLVGQGLDFLISICQPIEDAIHFVSGDGPALSQAADNFNAIGEGVQKLGQQFGEDLKSTLQGWGGDASEAAGTKLADFSKGLEGVAGQAGEIAQMLQMNSMIMTVIEEFIKAILTELITWMIMIWPPALAAAIPTAGGSTAAAGTATGVRAASSGSKVTRMVQKLKDLLNRVMDFIRDLKTRMGNLAQGFKGAMENKRMQSALADMDIASGKGSSLGHKLMSGDGMVGERIQAGFTESMKGAVTDTAKDQVGLHEGPGKLFGNLGDIAAVEEHGMTGEDQTKSETEDHLDI